MQAHARVKAYGKMQCYLHTLQQRPNDRERDETHQTLRSKSNVDQHTYYLTLGEYIHAEKGLLRELNPGPLAPEARIIPLDQAADSIGGCI